MTRPPLELLIAERNPGLTPDEISDLTRTTQLILAGPPLADLHELVEASERVGYAGDDRDPVQSDRQAAAITAISERLLRLEAENAALRAQAEAGAGAGAGQETGTRDRTYTWAEVKRAQWAIHMAHWHGRRGGASQEVLSALFWAHQCVVSVLDGKDPTDALPEVVARVDAALAQADAGGEAQ